VVVALLVAAERGFGVALAIAAFLLPFFLRGRAVSQFMKNLRGPSPGQTSDVETRYLRMSLDHDSGTLDGTVLDGRYRGRHLRELDLGELMDLLRECRINDEQSAAILESYLDRIHGAGWRDEEAGTGRAGGGPRSAAGSTMTRDEAYEILGLKPGAGPEEIKQAHHRMMLKNHPDQGGSTYLATKINQAKDLLLGE